MTIGIRLGRILKDECAQALLLGAICMALLMAAMTLAVDVGYMHYSQEQLQTAADSAALAAGLEISNCNNTVCTNMQTAAEQALIEDGITGATVVPTSNCTVSNSAGLAMIINIGPCVLGASDPNKGNLNMAEVVLTRPQSTFFGAIFGLKSFNLVAHAEAGEAYYLNSGGGNCIYTKSLEYNSSNGAFILNNCGIYDNGNLQTDNGDSVTASTFLYAGTWSPNNCNSSCTWTLGNGQTQPSHTNTTQDDPLKNLTAPTQPAASSTANVTAPTSNVTLSPGYYSNSVNINSGITVNLNPGLYYFGNGSSINVSGTLSCTACTGGNGVTLYFTGGTIQPNSGATITLSAPNATGVANYGGVANMLIWEGGSDSSGLTIDASSSSYYNGVIYLPDGTLTLNSGSGTTINSLSSATALDANNIIVNASVTFKINGSGTYLGSGGPTLGKFALAE